MKKTLLIISLTILTITTVKSQEKIQFGVLGSVNFTSMTSNDLLNKEEYKTGFQIGALVEIPFGKKFSLQPEILYSTQGVKGIVPLYYDVIPGAPAPEPVFGEYTLDYIKIPVLAKIYLIKNFSLEIGPSFNFLINDEFKYNSITYTDLTKSFEFGGVIGLSYKIKSRFIVNAKYFSGFSDVSKSDFAKPKNYGFSIGIGYLIK
mgnify:FL=1|tara:strand:+ start:60 stop:671 length:612 start_codon:yes stop_codon:yes gene_type:complete